MKRKSSPTRKRNIIISAVVILLVLAAGIGFAVKNSKNKTTDTTGAKQFSGPTEQEKADADAHKDEVVEQIKQEDQAQNSGNTQEKRTVTPVVTSASQNGNSINVSGYVSGVFEDGGSCVITISQGDNKVVKTSKAFENVSTTQCEQTVISRSEFPASGNWQVVISYDSATAKGVSQAQSLAIN
jgi:preprotein translocase subunit SecF